MSSRYVHENVELTPIVAKPLYFGLVVNVAIPVGLLMVCYWLNNRMYLENRLGDFANPLMYIFVAIGLAKALAALWWREKMLTQPMVRRKETFEQDVLSGFIRISRPVFLLIASISLYGYVYFFLTGRFEEAVIFVLMSFLAFQVVRPRFGKVRKVVEQQMEMVAQGKFRRSLLDTGQTD